MATQKTNTGVPGIPTAALDAIKDENVRQVLTALVDGWHVRNGASGNGDSQFITRSELANGVNGAFGYGAQGQQIQQIPPKTGGTIGSIISKLQASIFESVLWKELGSRITLIGRLYSDLKDGITDITVLGEGEVKTLRAIKTSTVGNTALIASEQEVRTNSDNALASAINTMWAAVGDNTALVQGGSKVVVNNSSTTASNWTQLQATVQDPVTKQYISSVAIRQDSSLALSTANGIQAKYTIKIDNNGYVSGYGLISESNNSAPYSSFYVRADRFAIGSPEGPTIEPAIPFIVLTTKDPVTNTPPGVYIKDAFIQNAAVDTLKIGGNAVTVPMSVTYYEPNVLYQMVFNANNSDFRLVVASSGQDFEKDAYVSATITAVAGPISACNFRAAIFLVRSDLTEYHTMLDIDYSMPSVAAYTPVFSSSIAVPSNGTWQVAVWVGNSYPSGSFRLSQLALNAFGAKR